VVRTSAPDEDGEDEVDAALRSKDYDDDDFEGLGKMDMS